MLLRCFLGVFLGREPQGVATPLAYRPKPPALKPLQNSTTVPRLSRTRVGPGCGLLACDRPAKRKIAPTDLNPQMSRLAPKWSVDGVGGKETAVSPPRHFPFPPTLSVLLHCFSTVFHCFFLLLRYFFGAFTIPASPTRVPIPALNPSCPTCIA